MAPTAHLPLVLHDKIRQTLSEVYCEAIRTSTAANRSSAEVARDVSASILLSVQEVISCAAREQNRRSSHQNRLPDELWCLIWKGMSFSARIAITHVCSDWRTAALRCPAIWQRLTFFTTIHDLHCECDTCGGLSGSTGRGQPKSSFPQNTSNVDSAPILLSRSRDLPLYATLYVMPHRACPDALHRLAKHIAKQSHRLSDLSICSAEPGAAVEFLRQFKSLSWLQHLVLDHLTDRKDSKNVLGDMPAFIPSSLLLPRLEALHMSFYFMWPLGKQRFESLQALSMSPLVKPERACFEALRACPRLSTLFLDLSLITPKNRPFDYGVGDGWPTLVRALHAVKIVRPPHKTWPEAFLRTWPALQSLFLEYPSRAELIGGAAGEVFRDLGRSLHLRVTGTPALLTAQASDDSQRTRRVSLRLQAQASRDDLSSIVSCVPHECWQNVTTVTLDASLWTLFDDDFLAGAAAVRALRLVVNEVPKTDSRGEGTHCRKCAQFPALRTLVLIGGTWALTLSPKGIDAFVRRLHLSLPLAVLEVDHRLIAGDATVLRDLAASVVIGVCHV